METIKVMGFGNLGGLGLGCLLVIFAVVQHFVAFRGQIRALQNFVGFDDQYKSLPRSASINSSGRSSVLSDKLLHHPQ